MNKVITIGRQFGTLGSEIGEKLSLLTGIPCYDSAALAKLAEMRGISTEMFEKADEQATSSFLYSLATSSYNGTPSQFHLTNLPYDRVYNVQSEEIKRIAEEGDCIIVGRCADDVLSDCEGLLKIFIYAPLDVRVKNLVDNYGMNESEAKKRIQKMDKKRASYYNFYTGREWGDPKNYHLNIDASLLGVAGTAELIKVLMEKCYK